MSYRDEQEALRAHVSHLESELVAAQDKIATLSGQSAAPAPEPERSLLIGGPSGVQIERVLDFEIDDEGLEAIAQLVRVHLGVPVSQVGRVLSSGPGDVFYLRREEGRTLVRIRRNWSTLAGGVVATTTLLTTLGAFASTGILHDVVHASPGTILMSVAAIVPVLASGVALLARRRAKRAANHKLRDHHAVMEAVVAVAAEHRVSTPIEARVVTADEEEEEIVAPDRREDTA